MRFLFNRHSRCNYSNEHAIFKRQIIKNDTFNTHTSTLQRLVCPHETIDNEYNRVFNRNTFEHNVVIRTHMRSRVHLLGDAVNLLVETFVRFVSQ